ncbi:hypothetical protein A2U01_0070171, partial [Trifolium medium]|nr:hypothetical protein [Trifolium medium]
LPNRWIHSYDPPSQKRNRNQQQLTQHIDEKDDGGGRCRNCRWKGRKEQNRHRDGGGAG